MIGFSGNDRFLITGASSGIGKAAALRLNELGATVIAVARDEGRLSSVRSSARSSDRVSTETRDLGMNMETLAEWVIQVSSKYGKLRGAVFAAGMSHTVPAAAISLERTRSLLELNLVANIMLAKGFCNAKANTGAGSSIVFVGSAMAHRGAPGLIDYCSSKAALAGVTRSLALEVAKKGIRVNMVSPGYVRTPMLASNRTLPVEDFVRHIDDTYPLGIGEPEDVADLIVFLLSDSARWMTGSDLIIDGGGTLV